MVNNKILFNKAEELRKIGKSYSEIKKRLGVSKSTLSCWFSDKEWSKSVKIQLSNKYKNKNTNRLIRINRLRKLETIKRHNYYRQQAGKEYQKLKANPLFIAGLSIYWGEGEKIEKGRVAVINTDTEMLQVIVNFYRRILNVPEEKLRAAIFIYKDTSEKKALKYWSEKVGISKKRFIKTQVLPSRSTLTKNKVLKGMCNVYFCSTETNIKINEWIRLLASDMRV